MLLEANRINVNIGPVQVLRNLTINIEKGETISLVGRNGAGKTSTIKSIIGLYQVKSGKIIFDGQEITTVPPHVRATELGIGYSPEDSRVFPDLTVEENIKLGIWLSRRIKDEKEIEEIIFSIFTEIKKLWKRRGLYCSGGEKKMVSIARALALKPKLLLLDEAFEGLAPIVVDRFIKAVNQIKEMGIAILVAESNVNNAARVGERLYAIDRGEIIYEGEPQKIFQDQTLLNIIRGY
ncbi:MAG TPA: ATP-binding cassette domain-containing protein [Candidatus Caldiarchaeum subterraneum]|uniref:ATP-binding cassette domain-containing protein n=1 Tax=Caldiarchaeum subterraneum TaxID=311458 RepID=A0A832ZWG1_CALS0|nr:ATP-binding cassette domain-containing protein [Candidatus Caldarchaeum subterraneum]